MIKRPVSVTVISWILIVLGALGVVGMLFSLSNPAARQAMALNPLPIPVQLAMAFFGLAVSVVAGACMLKGANWARFLYIGWSVCGFAISFFTTPAKLMLVPGIVIFVVLAAFLLTPKANAYFAPKTDAGL